MLLGIEYGHGAFAVVSSFGGWVPEFGLEFIKKPKFWHPLNNLDFLQWSKHPGGTMAASLWRTGPPHMEMVVKMGRGNGL